MGDVTVTTHFRQRVAERIGPDTDPEHLAEGIFRALDNVEDDVIVYLGRTRHSKARRRVMFTAAETGHDIIAVIDTHDRVAITVLRNDGDQE
jgi:Tfp pilus assembly pilus retraction ATPase PilT